MIKSQINRIIGFSSLLTGLLALSCVISIGRRTAGIIEVLQIEIPIQGLPLDFDGFTVCQISDFHFKQHDKMDEKLLTILKESNLKYDIICLTGDYSYSALSFGVAKNFLTLLDFKETYAVNGNSDLRQMFNTYRADEFNDEPFLKDNVKKYLLNENIEIWRGENKIYLAGVDEVSYGRDNLKKALEGISDDDMVILLAHNPEIITKDGDNRIKLILSGHTHGGQICLPNGYALYNNTKLSLKYSSGLHDVWNHTKLYVNRGIGVTRIPIRLNSYPEVSIIKLRSVNGN